MERNIYKIEKELFITSDEEIKEGDWFLSLISNSIQRELTLDWTLDKNLYKKIIITTDQSLISDGVQAIDDEFLEWFVKHPSCECVEVYKFGFDDPLIRHTKKYEIIIPKSTQEIIDEDYSGGLTMGQIIPKEEPKQETLEEAAKKYSECHQDVSGTIGKYLVKAVFQDGAEWQEQNSDKKYSEEEVRKISLDFFYYWWNSKGTNTEQGFDKWFEQFKKK